MAKILSLFPDTVWKPKESPGVFWSLLDKRNPPMTLVLKSSFSSGTFGGNQNFQHILT